MDGQNGKHASGIPSFFSFSFLFPRKVKETYGLLDAIWRTYYLVKTYHLVYAQASNNVTRLGQEILKNSDVFPDKNWFWIGAAALLGFILLFNVLFTFALSYLKRRYF